MKRPTLHKLLCLFLAGLLCATCFCSPVYALDAEDSLLEASSAVSTAASEPLPETSASSALNEENPAEDEPIEPAEDSSSAASDASSAVTEPDSDSSSETLVPETDNSEALGEEERTEDEPVEPDETSEFSPSKLPSESPTEEEIAHVFAGDLPDVPTGSYIGRYGLPVPTGDTKISIGQWNNELTMSDESGYLDAKALHAEEQTTIVALQQESGYAIVPIMTQVEYPANGSTSTVILPDDVTLLSFSSDYGITAANKEEKAAILNGSYHESSASASGFYVQAAEDFTAQFVYTAPDGSTLTKSLHVRVDKENTVQADPSGSRQMTSYASRPAPSITSGKITAVQKVNGTWLIWFNGQQAYCCSHGLNGQPNGCPQYTYAYTSLVTADQYTPGDHYANQINIWGGIGQLSLGLLSVKHEDDVSASAFAASELAEPDVLETAYTYYDDTQLWIMKHYPDSLAAKSYLSAARQLADGVNAQSMGSNYYTYIYTPPISGWQTVALIGPPVEGEDPGIPPVPREYYASWSAAPQTASGSFDSHYGINTDKVQLETLEKVDGAVIEVEPLEKGGTIDGGSWAIDPARKQTLTTSGHTPDNDYQSNGGDGTASWSLHYTVSKTSTTSRSGREGPYNSRAEADAAAASACASAENQLLAEAQGMVDKAIAKARDALSILHFRFNEITVPYGFEPYAGDKGSRQTISVPADSNNDYRMHNDEWSVQVKLKKADSETGKAIADDTLFEVFEWDVVTEQYIPYGGYNLYSVDFQPEGWYSVINRSSYATEAIRHNMYYTQRNEGKFVLVETRAPSGYYGDWSDVEAPGPAATPLGKRGYYIEITKENDGSVIWLENNHYSADIATEYTGGTELLTSDGTETTVAIYKESNEPAAKVLYQNASRGYNTDNSQTAANENSYTMHPQPAVFQNDRVLGEISLSKVDLDAVRYLNGRDTTGDVMASGQAHADARLDGAVYDLYVAEDILHPDGTSGVVDYAKILDADGWPIWHTTIRDNSGQWVSNYLPVLAKDRLVASAEIVNGWLTFANLYLGNYYIVERGTGVVIPVERGVYKASGTCPTIDAKTNQPTGSKAPLAVNAKGQYTDYVYKNQWSAIGQGKALDGTRTHDGYYESYAKGYLCDEHNYYISPAYSNESWYIEKTTFQDNRQAEDEPIDTTVYSANCHVHKSNELAESDDQVMKGNVELSKHVSSTGSSDGMDLEGAGFTFFLISDLSKVNQFSTTRSGGYVLSSILKAYINPRYDDTHPKYDFSAEGPAIAKTYEVDTAQIAAYNKSLTAAGDYRNGSGLGWVATSRANEYQLAEIFSNDTGTIRVQGLPYGQYLVVETTTPKDVFQAQPFIVTIDPAQDNNPQSGMCNPKDASQKPSDSYQKYTVLDEEMEVYLRITKIDAETGKAVLLPDTSFQIYWMDEAGNYLLDDKGNPRLVTMTDTKNGHLTKDVDTFYTTGDGVLTLPEKLPLGHYRIVEVTGPHGFYNEWAATALQQDGSFYVDFDVTTDRVYKATGDDNENSQDTVVIDEEYHNSETLGKLTIRKSGEVLTGWQQGQFVYEQRPLANAVYTITAAENIYTQDRQTDPHGNRNLWYAKGDVVAVVKTDDGASDTVNFAPGRTPATYDFLSVVHDSTVGEVSITLPLGSYHIEETTPPYGYVGTAQRYDVTFAWSDQRHAVVMSESITSHGEDGSARTSRFAVVDATTASPELMEQQVLKFYNDREKAAVKVAKRDAKTSELVAGAVFDLYTKDDIYTADGTLLFRADAWIATSAPTDASGYTAFSCDIPLRSEFYGVNGNTAGQNSGRFAIVEQRPPQGYFLNDTPMEITFTYTGQAEQVLESTCYNKATSMLVSKRDLTNDDELPGATLTIRDKKGNVVRQWVSGKIPTEIRGLHLNTVYTLTETHAPGGYALADSIRFKLVQRLDKDGEPLNENDVYICTGKTLLFFDRWELLKDGMVVMYDRPLPPEPPVSVVPPAPTVPQTGDSFWLPVALAGFGVLATASLVVLHLADKKRKTTETKDTEESPSE